jgi:hypothetical protein
MQRNRQCAYNGNIEAHSRSHFCRRKEINIVNSECLSIALFIQQTQHMRRTMSSSLACPAAQNFPTLSHKLPDFRK